MNSITEIKTEYHKLKKKTLIAGPALTRFGKTFELGFSFLVLESLLMELLQAQHWQNVACHALAARDVR